MRKLFLFLMVCSVMACNNEADTNNNAVLTANNAADAAQLTTIQWLDSSKNLGRINEGQKVEVSFRFKNTGDKPLIIRSVQPGCGCTVADYPKEPIAPGAQGEITGSFDSKGREGLQHKEIMVTANTIGSPDHRIAFEVEVLKAKS